MSREGYKVKNVHLEVKDIDPQTRRVKIMASAFDNIDSDSDVIRFGAFAKSINERGPESQHPRLPGKSPMWCWHHDHLLTSHCRKLIVF